jgi:acyl-CoA reductase-like NAD-dependent aldehyde dehydrogenase
MKINIARCEVCRIEKQESATVLTCGECLSSGSYQHGYFHQPAIFGSVDQQIQIAQEEIFGPVTAIIPVNNLDEAIKVANGVRYGLSSAIYTPM